jgi:hypothetical protein
MSRHHILGPDVSPCIRRVSLFIASAVFPKLEYFIVELYVIQESM